MREILFRGKRMDTGEWVEGFYCNHDTVKVCLTTDDPKTKHLIVMDGFCDWGFEPPLQGVEVDPATVGQYTGLLDKNGKRVFEGDVVSTDLERPYLIVEFRDGCFMFNCNDKGEDYYDIMLPILKEPQTVYKYGEVIGNIHDNPELLEVTPDE